MFVLVQLPDECVPDGAGSAKILDNRKIRAIPIPGA